MITPEASYFTHYVCHTTLCL